MKKQILFAALICGAGIFGSVKIQAQTNDTTTVGQDLKSAAQKTGKVVEKGAKKVGNKTAQIASNGKASVTDKIYKDKVGPDGQRIYINSHAQFYWIDTKGHNHYVTEDQLKDKTL